MRPDDPGLDRPAVDLVPSNGPARWRPIFSGTLIVLVVVMVSLIAVNLALWRTGRADATAVVVDVAGEDVVYLRVVDGPSDRVHGARWTDVPEVGQTVAVDLRGPCRCEPAQPEPFPTATVALPMLFAAWATWNLVSASRMVRRSRRAHAASAAAADEGTPLPVRVRISWDALGVRRVEVHPTSDNGTSTTAPLRFPTRALDPTIEFLLWTPQEGGPDALTSVDHRQLLTLDEPLQPLADAATTDVALTNAVAGSLGWPPADPDPELRATTDRSVDAALARMRAFRAIVIVAAAIVAGSWLTDGSTAWAMALVGIGTIVIALLRANSWVLAPIDAAVCALATARDADLRKRTVRAIWALRWFGDPASGGGRGG